MAYKTFSFIKGKPDDNGNFGIKNAIQYRLYKWIGNLEPDELGGDVNGEKIYQNPDNWQEFEIQRLPQEIDVRGAINDEGQPHEYVQLISIGATLKDKFPITKETNKGFVYYFRFTGTMSVTTTAANFSGVPFNGVLYIEGGKKSSIKIDAEATFSGNDGNGVYLKVYVGSSATPEKVKIYSLGAFSENSVLSATIERCLVHSSVDGYFRTTYIPIDCLINGLESGCVGPFATWADLYTDINKISFYDANFNFLSGVSLYQIRDYLDRREGEETGYLTVDDVKGLANNAAAKYVIFCSAIGEKLDKVSIGGIYFPLFAYDDLAFGDSNGKEYTLSVKAVSDGFFFSDSKFSGDPSKPDELIKYTR